MKYYHDIPTYSCLTYGKVDVKTMMISSSSRFFFLSFSFTDLVDEFGLNAYFSFKLIL